MPILRALQTAVLIIVAILTGVVCTQALDGRAEEERTPADPAVETVRSEAEPAFFLFGAEVRGQRRLANAEEASP